MDNNPRPQKRAKIDYLPNSLPSLTSSPLTPLPSPPKPSPKQDQLEQHNQYDHDSVIKLKPMPSPALLVSLPGLLIHPPNHRYHVLSLQLSLKALRKCLGLPGLTPEVECRAWMGFAEVGMNVIGGGLTEDEGCVWAKGIEAEVSKALSKGAIIAQKHPSLRLFRHHIALLQARFSHWQHKTKFARTQIRTLISSLQPSDPPYILYSAHLVLISLFTSPVPPASPNNHHSTQAPPPPPPPSPIPKAQDVNAALAAIQDLETLSKQQNHSKITLLAHVLRLRILTTSNQWSSIPQSLQIVETALGLSYDPTTTPKPPRPPVQEKSKKPEERLIFFENPFEASMAIHVIFIGVVYYTYVGDASRSSPRLSHLHGLLDGGALETFADGVVSVDCGSGTPLILQVTHPRVLLLLVFLLSSVAKRDAVGRKPKRKVFAVEGVKAWDRDVIQQLLVPLWSDMGDVDEVEYRLGRIKADLLCELVAASIMRSEFDAAEENLDLVIAHTRTFNIFHLYAGRISLHHAHLAHALGKKERALECYRVAGKVMAGDGELVGVMAQAGEISIRLADVLARKEVQCESGTMEGRSEKIKGKKRARNEEMEENEDVAVTLEWELEELHEMANGVIGRCRGMGATQQAIGHILEACFSPEILKAKSHLKAALSLATSSQDNHLRALILAFIASQYMYTAGDHAFSVLQAIDQLGAGLGASSSKALPSSEGGGEDGNNPTKARASPSVGNAPLRLWAGERFLELYKRTGQEKMVQKQVVFNARFAEAVEALGDQRG